MKTISIVVPCYNEEENVIPLSRAITALFEKELADYRYELIFIDNDSRDRHAADQRGLHHSHGGGFPGPGGDDSPVRAGVGVRV